MIFELTEQRRKKAGKKDEGKNELTGIHLVTKPCVVKITTGHRYIYVKCLSLEDTLARLNKLMRQWERGTGKIGEDNLWIHFLRYVSRTNQEHGAVEILEETTDAYKLLVAEQKALDKGRHDENCLNNAMDAYIPIYNEVTLMNGWISPKDVLRFNNWKRRKDKPVKKAAKKAPAKKAKKAAKKG